MAAKVDSFVIQLRLNATAASHNVSTMYLLIGLSLAAVGVLIALAFLPNGYVEPRPEDDPEG